MSEGSRPRLSLPPLNRYGIALVVLLAVIVATQVLFTVLPQTDIVPQAVDFARDLPFVGPDRMAALEDLVYSVQDGWNRWIYDLTHAPVITSSTAATAIAERSSSSL